jgi:hypothetical protein
MMSPLERRLLLARTIYVDASATGTNDGTSWPTAYTDLQSALAIATSGDTIDVAQGTYKPTTSTDPSVTISSTFNLVDGVSLLGGFAGNAAANPNSRDTSTFPTILSGNFGDTSRQSGSSCHVVTARDIGSATVLDGFTIEGGVSETDLSIAPEGEFGTGMLISDASPTIQGCTFTGNNSLNGAVAALGASAPSISDCTFSANTSDDGGAMYLGSSLAIGVQNCTFSGNARESKVSNGRGGAAFVQGHAMFSGCSFESNTSGEGGSIYAVNWVGGASDCSLSNNTAGEGGAIFIDTGCSVSLNNCGLSGNSAVYSEASLAYFSDGDGGALFEQGSSAALEDCTFSNNQGSAGGAAFTTNSQSSSFIDCSFSGNSARAASGGALLNSDSVVDLIACTFTSNSSNLGPLDGSSMGPFSLPGGQGGALYDTSATVTMQQCRFDANSGTWGGADYENNSRTTIVDTLFERNIASAYQVPIDLRHFRQL